jgi:hypothetical protein
MIVMPPTANGMKITAIVLARVGGGVRQSLLLSTECSSEVAASSIFVVGH